MKTVRLQVPLSATTSYSIWQNVIIQIGKFGTEASINTTYPVPWDTRIWRPEKAELHIRAKQDYMSGASLLIRMNNYDVTRLSWGAFDTSEKSEVKDVTSLLSNGNNLFNARYNIAYTAIWGQKAEVNVTLIVTYRYVGPPGEEDQHPPPGGLPPAEDWWWWVIGIAATAGIIGVVGVVVWEERKRTEQFMQMMMMR